MRFNEPLHNDHEVATEKKQAFQILKQYKEILLKVALTFYSSAFYQKVWYLYKRFIFIKNPFNGPYKINDNGIISSVDTLS